MPTEAEVEAGRDEIARRLQQLHKLHLAQRQPRHYLQMRNMEGEGETLGSLAITVTRRSGSIQSAQQAARQEAHVASVAEMASTRILAERRATSTHSKPHAHRHRTTHQAMPPLHDKRQGQHEKSLLARKLSRSILAQCPLVQGCWLTWSPSAHCTWSP